jgi:hypothetical protein
MKQDSRTMKQDPRLLLAACKNRVATAADLAETIMVLADDQESLWWGPLVENPVDGLTVAAISAHALEGAARHRAAVQLSEQLTEELVQLSRALHQIAMS